MFILSLSVEQPGIKYIAPPDLYTEAPYVQDTTAAPAPRSTTTTATTAKTTTATTVPNEEVAPVGGDEYEHDEGLLQEIEEDINSADYHDFGLWWRFPIHSPHCVSFKTVTTFLIKIFSLEASVLPICKHSHTMFVSFCFPICYCSLSITFSIFN